MNKKQYLAQTFEPKEVVVNHYSLNKVDNDVRRFYLYIRDTRDNTGHDLQVKAVDEEEAIKKFKEYLGNNFKLVLSDIVYTIDSNKTI